MWTEATLLDAAAAHFGGTQPVYLLRQVEVEDRRIDGVLIVGEKRVGIEVKTSRADFRNETDDKRRPTERAMNGCVYLCPPDVIARQDLPYGWGLWYAMSPAKVRVIQKPMWHGIHPFAADSLATMLTRRAAATERRVRAAERAEDPAGALVAVDREVQRLEGLLAQARDAVRRERARAQDAAEQVLALLGEQDCSACEHPIVYTRVGAWRHVERDREKPCAERRAEAERQRRMAATGAEYGAVMAPRVTPKRVSDDC